MILPSVHALTVENFAQARSFFYTGTLGLFLLSMIALAASNRKLEETGVQQLASLALGFFVLPLYLAIPNTMPSVRHILSMLILIWSVHSPQQGL